MRDDRKYPSDGFDRAVVIALAAALALLFFYIVGKGMIVIFGGGA